jgi:glucosamine 6-phosphate synthetase-like amidotransferase/phosphosugar isomerase protein
MCGLVGIYSSNMLAKHKDVLSAMLYLDTWRGRDSTGVAAIRHNADTVVLKSTVPGYEFVEGPKLDQHLKLNDFCWIGHNRFGTMGKNIKTNAHPFTIDDDQGACLLVGAHNGTLKNKHVLLDHVKFGTDSEALYNNIAVEGLEKSIEKVEGAWALTYYDHIEEELRIIRNKERPLFYAFEEGKKTLIWASEMWMIRVACSRYDVKLEGDKVFAFAEDTLYRFPAPMKMNEEIGMERKGGIVGKQTPTFFQNWNRERCTGGETGGHTTTHTQGAATRPGSSTSSTAIAASSTQSTTPPLNNGEKLVVTNASSSDDTSNGQPDGKVRDILSAKKYKGYSGVLLTAKELELQLENGCGWCELEFITEKDKFAWLAPSKPICHKCLTGEPEPDKKIQQVVCH